MKHKDSSRQIIAYVVPGLGISGGIGVAFRHVFELTKLGHKAQIFVTGADKAAGWHPLQDKIKIHPISAYYRETGPDGADHLVATWWETAFVISELRARNKHFFVQGLEHLFYAAGDPKRTGFLMALNLGYRTMTVARWIQNWLRQNFRINAEYVPNGLEEAFFRAEKPAVRTQSSRPLRVLIEGPASLPFKRIPDSFAVVKDLDAEIWYVNSGGSTDRNWKIDRYFEKLPMSSMPEIYRQCDVILKMCGIESFSLPVAEMLATGGTAVVTDGPGFREYGGHERNLLIARDASIASARQELIRLIENPALLRRLQANAAKSVGQFTWQRTIRTLEGYFATAERTPAVRDPEIVKALLDGYRDLKTRDFYHKIGLSKSLERIAQFGYWIKFSLHACINLFFRKRGNRA